MLKEICQKMIWENYYVNNFIYRLLPFSERRKMFKRISEMKFWDTIQDVTEIKKLRRQVQEGLEFRTPSPEMGNTHIYGIWHNLYADLIGSNVKYSPAVEHGLIFGDEVLMDTLGTSRSCISTFSSFRKKIIQKYINKPVFLVGPYINYADGYYSEERTHALKEKLGKVLLVFPMHSTDDSALSVREELFVKGIKEIGKKFDTVIINAFWWNINDSLIEKLESEGCHISCAGFRDDPFFLSRLKTLLDIADFAVGDGVGTHIGYCISRRIPFRLIEVGSSYKEDPMESDSGDVCLKEIYDAFLGASSITDCQVNICNKYWGMDICCSKDELRVQCDICKDIFLRTKGNNFLVHYAVKKLLKKYISIDETKYHVLKNAIE